MVAVEVDEELTLDLSSPWARAMFVWRVAVSCTGRCPADTVPVVRWHVTGCVHWQALRELLQHIYRAGLLNRESALRHLEEPYLLLLIRYYQRTRMGQRNRASATDIEASSSPQNRSIFSQSGPRTDSGSVFSHCATHACVVLLPPFIHGPSHCFCLTGIFPLSVPASGPHDVRVQLDATRRMIVAIPTVQGARCS